MNLYIPVAPIITVDDEKKLLKLEMNPNLVGASKCMDAEFREAYRLLSMVQSEIVTVNKVVLSDSDPFGSKSSGLVGNYPGTECLSL